MYTIEYYKTKRKEPNIKEKEGLANYEKDSIEKCWNIKSITIDIEDIKHIIYDEKLYKLYGLYARINRENLDNSIRSITILNNNLKNQLCIYEILNCDWMVNQYKILDNLETLKIARQLSNRIQEYDSTSKPFRKKNVEVLIDYYISTIMNKDKKDRSSDTKTLKLGKRFIKQKQH